MCGDVECNPGPTSPSSNVLRFVCKNICSAIHKAALIQDLMSDHSLDVIALSETRYQRDIPNSILSEVAPDGFSVQHVFRSPTANHPAGGGLSFVHRNNVVIKSVQSGSPTPTSFELQESRCYESHHVTRASRSSMRTVHPTDRSPHFMTNSRTSFRPYRRQRPIICSYVVTSTHPDRTPPPSIRDSTMWSRLWGSNNSWNLPHKLALITSLILSSPTNHRTSETFASSTPGFVSDHQLIQASININSSGSSTRPVSFTYRQIKNIDPADFESKLRRSSLFTSLADDAESFAEQIERVVTATLDEVAPIRTRQRRPPKAVTRWLSKEAVEAKRHRRRLERRWNETKSDTDRLAYRRACRHVNKLINSSRQDYLRSQLSSATDSKQRWQIAKIPASLVQDCAWAFHRWTKTTLQEILRFFRW